MAAFVLLDLLSFWGSAWRVRDLIAVSGASLISVTMFAGAYYLAAHLVFPRDVEDQPYLNAHFLRVRRVVIGVMAALLLCQLGWYASLPEMAAFLARPRALVLTAILIVLMAAAMLVRSERACRWVMVALVARYLVVYLL